MRINTTVENFLCNCWYTLPIAIVDHVKFDSVWRREQLKTKSLLYGINYEIVKHLGDLKDKKVNSIGVVDNVLVIEVVV